MVFGDVGDFAKFQIGDFVAFGESANGNKLLVAPAWSSIADPFFKQNGDGESVAAMVRTFQGHRMDDTDAG